MYYLDPVRLSLSVSRCAGGNAPPWSEGTVMKKVLTRAITSLAVVATVGFGGAAVASTASAATCSYPFAVQTAAVQPGGSPSPQCWSPGTTTPTQAVISTPPASPVVANTPAAAPDPLPATVSGSTTLAQTTGSLAFTGADIWQTVLVGVVLIGGGLTLVRLSRRRRRTV